MAISRSDGRADRRDAAGRRAKTGLGKPYRPGGRFIPQE
jgi:hypothetical protein